MSGPYSEQLVSERLQITRAELREIRKDIFFINEDFIVPNGSRSIAITDAGLKKLSDHIAALRNKAVDGEKKEPAISDGKKTKRAKTNPDAKTEVLKPENKEPARPIISEPVFVKVKITQKVRNPRMLFAVLDGRPVRVRVRDSWNFTIGTEITVRKDTDDFFTFEGIPPRRRGGRKP